MSTVRLSRLTALGLILGALVFLPGFGHAADTPDQPPAITAESSTPADPGGILVADNTINKFIVEQCKAIAVNPDAEPNCQGKCISALHVCCDEKTGICTFTPQCERKLQAADEACFP